MAASPTPPVFPVRTLIEGFKLVEEMLADFLHHVPCSPEHDQVWSPRLITVLLEACGQLDSLWRFEATHGPTPLIPAGTDFNIKDYHRGFGSRMAREWVVLWGEEGRKLEPFAPWTSAGYVRLEWWKAYNQVKHDRLTHRKEATFKHAADATAGLFLAILRSPHCRDALGEAGFVDLPADGIAELGRREMELLHGHVQLELAESKLMSCLWETVPAQPAGKVRVMCERYRFFRWYKNNCPHLNYDFS